MRGGLRRRLADLERRCPPPASSGTDPARQRRWEAVLGRWERLVEQAWPLLTEAEQGQVNGAVAQMADELCGPYRDWLRHLAEGWCRLPELPAAAMRDLLLAWLSPQADGGLVCAGCGLEYPRHRTPPLSEWKLLPGRRPLEGPPPWYDLPELFAACPGCGRSSLEADWPQLTAQQHHSWQALDGFVGGGP